MSGSVAFELEHDLCWLGSVVSGVNPQIKLLRGDLRTAQLRYSRGDGTPILVSQKKPQGSCSGSRVLNGKLWAVRLGNPQYLGVSGMEIKVTTANLGGPHCGTNPLWDYERIWPL